MTAAGRMSWRWTPCSMTSGIFPTKCSSSCLAAAIATPTGSAISPGRTSPTHPRAGRGFRQSATSFTATLHSITRTPIVAHRLWWLHRQDRRVPRLRPPCDHALPMHEHSGPLLHRISRRYRCSARARSDGFQRLVPSLSRRQLVYLRCSPQYAEDRADPDGDRPRCDGRGAFDQLRPVEISSASKS